MLAKTKALLARPFIALAALIVVLGLGATVVQATLMNTADVIEPPAVIDKDTDQPTNTRQQAFEERQHVVLEEDVSCTSGAAVAGDVVNSHTIFYNTRFLSPEVDADRVWEFDGEVLCVMAETNGLKQALTDSLFGAPGTVYPGPFAGRGLEIDGSDSYAVSGNTITVTMTSEPTGDSIRVLTRAAVPNDTTPPVVYCEPGSNPGGKVQDNKNDGKGSDQSSFLALIGADETDGTVELFLTDTVSGAEFGPFAPGTQVQITTAKGAKTGQEAGEGPINYKLKVNGATTITATDEAGNIGEATCSQ